MDDGAVEIHGDIGGGNVGVVASRAGVGKSACMVQMALSRLLAGKRVMHVSLENTVSHVRNWYDEALIAMAQKGLVTDLDNTRFSIERRRIIHSYLGGTFSPHMLDQALKLHAEHSDFEPQAIFVDGMAIGADSTPEIESLVVLARTRQAELWLSVLTHRSEPMDETTNLPVPLPALDEMIKVVLFLEPEGQSVQLRLLKGPDGERFDPTLRFDPAFMLVVRQ